MGDAVLDFLDVSFDRENRDELLFRFLDVVLSSLSTAGDLGSAFNVLSASAISVSWPSFSLRRS